MKQEEKNEDGATEYKEHLKLMKEDYFESMNSNSDAHDRQLLTLSSTLLAASVGFLGKPAIYEHCHTVIIVSWVFLAFTILLVMLSFKLGNIVMDKCVFELTSVLFGDKQGQEYKAPPTCARCFNNLCNWLSPATFFIGLLLTIIYAAINL